MSVFPHIDRPVILASASPRRANLLSQLGIEYSIDPPEIDEDNLTDPTRSPRETAEFLSRKKAEAVGQRYNHGFLIASDTIVSLGEVILGKPVDSEDAFRILSLLSGKQHQVITGVTLSIFPEDQFHTFSVTTNVRFRTLNESEIREYTATGEPNDKAGAYGIQGKGALLVDSIEGDYYNVVGFPLTAFYTESLKLLDKES